MNIEEIKKEIDKLETDIVFENIKIKNEKISIDCFKEEVFKILDKYKEESQTKIDELIGKFEIDINSIYPVISSDPNEAWKQGYDVRALEIIKDLKSLKGSENNE